MYSSVVYLLITREFYNARQNVYKIGRSSNIQSRFKTYPNGSITLIVRPCKDCVESEKVIMREFKERFVQRVDIGSEYFEGDVVEMIETFNSLVPLYVREKPQERDDGPNYLVDDFLDKCIVKIDKPGYNLALTSIMCHAKYFFKDEYDEKPPTRTVVEECMKERFGPPMINNVWKSVCFRDDEGWI